MCRALHIFYGYQFTEPLITTRKLNSLIPFTDEETKAREEQITCPNSHSSSGGRGRMKPAPVPSHVPCCLSFITTATCVLSYLVLRICLSYTHISARIYFSQNMVPFLKQPTFGGCHWQVNWQCTTICATKVLSIGCNEHPQEAIQLTVRYEVWGKTPWLKPKGKDGEKSTWAEETESVKVRSESLWGWFKEQEEMQYGWGRMGAAEAELGEGRLGSAMRKDRETSRISVMKNWEATERVWGQGVSLKFLSTGGTWSPCAWERWLFCVVMDWREGRRKTMERS